MTSSPWADPDPQPGDSSSAITWGEWLYWRGMTSRVGAKGQVVIPKDLRDRTGLHPGAEVEFELRGDVLVLVTHSGPTELAGRFANSGMASRLLADRDAEPR